MKTTIDIAPTWRSLVEFTIRLIDRKQAGKELVDHLAEELRRLCAYVEQEDMETAMLVHRGRAVIIHKRPGHPFEAWVPSLSRTFSTMAEAEKAIDHEAVLSALREEKATGE